MRYSHQQVGGWFYAHPYYLEPIPGSSDERSVKHPFPVPCQIISPWGDGGDWVVRFDPQIKGEWQADQQMFREELMIIC